MSNTTDKLLVPLALPNFKKNSKGLQVLAGDVGGTKTNLALYKAAGGKMDLLEYRSYQSKKFDSLIDIIKQFIKDNEDASPEHICIGVAGPVIKEKVDLTNLPWKIDAENIRKATDIKHVSLINDLEATAYGLAGLKQKDLFPIREGDPGISGNIGVIAPGTGLGEAGLYFDGEHYHAFATEGGHCDFAPRTEQDMDLHQYLKDKFGVVSWEHVISGPGIYNIYKFLREEKKWKEPDWLTKKLESADDPTAIVSEVATEGKCDLCKETMRLFVRYLAHESCNLVLKMKATGGLFLGGGIPPKIIKLLLEERFYTHYLHCDRMQDLVKSVPTFVIMNDKTGMLGAAYYGAYVGD